MNAWLEELLLVVAYSSRMQFILVLGMVSFGALMIGSVYSPSLVDFHGPLASLNEVVRERLHDRYEHAAWLVLGSSLLTAVKFYRKDRKRLFGI